MTGTFGKAQHCKKGKDIFVQGFMKRRHTTTNKHVALITNEGDSQTYHQQFYRALSNLLRVTVILSIL